MKKNERNQRANKCDSEKQGTKTPWNLMAQSVTENCLTTKDRIADRAYKHVAPSEKPLY